MSLRVEKLTKIYGSQCAINNLSFTIKKGEIVGFLGPNGAGKSTTMKIATTYLPPTSGSVFVNEWDVVKHPMEVKKIVGYLPEHNPLYLDMYVHEYLRFVGAIYKVPNVTSRVREIIELCGLTKEQNKKMESLSKGYRQRVGLAQALIHNPEVLILDEPTSGLDPNQILEIRKLIKQISKEKTVILSTHILQEVQALCDRVIVIHLGSIVANEGLANLLASSPHSNTILVEWEQDVDIELIKKIEEVELVKKEGNTFRITSSSKVDIRAELFRFSTEKNLSLLSLRQENNSLEAIFQSLTTQEPRS